MALYEVTLRQRFQEQLCLNVWAYAADSGLTFSSNALELLTLMGFIPTGDPLELPASTIGARLLNLQSADVEWLSVEAREVYSLTDFYEAAYSPALVGENVGGESTAPFVAYGLYSTRVRTDIRRGFKRFVGVAENLMQTGGVLTSTGLSSLSALGDEMGVQLEGALTVYHPCIISRLKEEYIEDGDTKYRYVLYPDPAEQDEHLALDVEWAAYPEVRSQTSRQRGRGI